MSEKARFPGTFWAANVVELFERAAYYAVASFVVVYLHETLNMAPTKATFLNGTLLWGLLYFLPILSGTLADKYGFKKSLGISFALLVLGYFIMGNVQNFWPWFARVSENPNYTIPIVIGIFFIGIGGSFKTDHLRHGAEGLGNTQRAWIRHFLHDYQRGLHDRTIDLLCRADQPGHPGYLFLRGDYLRRPRISGNPLHLQGTPVQGVAQGRTIF